MEHLPPSTVFSLPLRTSVNIIKRLPKASRECAARKFAAILEAVVRKNDHNSWNRLLCFSRRCLRHPDRGECRRSLATAINNQLRDEADPPPALIRSTTRKRFLPADDPTTILAAHVSGKLEEGDFRGAVRLACSDDTLAPMNEPTFEALQEKHPSRILTPASHLLQSLHNSVPSLLLRRRLFGQSTLFPRDLLEVQMALDLNT